MSAAAGFKKHSVTMLVTTSEDVRARAGSCGFSAYVARAVARQLERDALDDVLQSTETKHGAVDEDEVAAIMARLAR
ncbi:hypothetical protein C8K30_111148 [Promicromonospora sp. AC04]|uniref:CopG family transcriptional regulator n=1 Tax=Promicromonospora sp. AC04 TaxID=2135723 RepID=UPI000D391FF3|nr:CopG family transcriptional regulator [Promicromonospora sp. AC04]PUB23550.1 hypothetical protein C8K30_111148 [Promicromonospora sp. AC04]